MAAPKPVVPVKMGDRLEMRKPHPCGGVLWTVTRVGMDIGLQCATCGRRVLLNRVQFERQLRRFCEPEPPN
ncbi:MAG TPA: DUF951 domain-containing protein [Armatimonadota bacterium]|nr:DUF951 domain-containing protein [Armatimonadota bacterium]